MSSTAIGPMLRDPATGKYRRTRLFCLTLGSHESRPQTDHLLSKHLRTRRGHTGIKDENRPPRTLRSTEFLLW